MKELGVNIFFIPISNSCIKGTCITHRGEEEENLHVPTEERLATLKKDAPDD